jgi:hypothetical protein
MPVSTAPARRRQAWPSARAASPVIHWLVPSSSAVRPSSDAAIFMRTQGRPRCMREKKPMFSSREASPQSPPITSTSIPAARRRAKPAPATRGFGSWTAATTRAMPAATSASQHGGVRPWCEQGSSVTTAVAPRVSRPASRARRRAGTSACSPAGLLRVAGGKHFAACRQQHAAHARIGVAQADGARRGLQGDLARGGFGDKCRHGRWWARHG